MKQKPDRGKRADGDGIRVEPAARDGWPWPLLVGAVGAVALVGWLVTGRADRRAPVARPEPAASVASERSRVVTRPWTDAAVRAREAQVVARRRVAAAAAEQPPGAAREGRANDGAPREIDAGDYIAALRAGGETEGLAAFPPPGTNPPRAGVVVPEGYDLPEGFARHYQTTDDGRQLEPVLAVAPEYDLVDADGNRIELRGDRIVPPEFAPPDLPVRMLDVPGASDRGSGSR